MGLKPVYEGIVEEVKSFLKDELGIKTSMLESRNGIEKSHLVSKVQFQKTNLRTLFVISVEEDVVIISFENIKSILKDKGSMIDSENYCLFLDKLSRVNNGLKFGKFLLEEKEENYLLSFRLSIMYENSLPIERFKRAVYTSLKTVSENVHKILG